MNFANFDFNAFLNADSDVNGRGVLVRYKSLTTKTNTLQAVAACEASKRNESDEKRSPILFVSINESSEVYPRIEDVDWVQLERLMRSRHARPAATTTVASSPVPRHQFAFMREMINQHARLDSTCDTKYVFVRIFCDEQIGNGHFALKHGAAVAFALNRKLLVYVHRRPNCDGALLQFHKHVHIVNSLESEERRGNFGPVIESYVATQRVAMACGSGVPPFTSFHWLGPTFSYFDHISCDCVNLNRSELVILVLDRLIGLHDVLRNPTLTSVEHARAALLFDLGQYTMDGLLMTAYFEVHSRVKQEFHGEYAPPADVLARLDDEHVFKMGMHIRHMPFVTDYGSGNNDILNNRAIGCLKEALLYHNVNISGAPPRAYRFNQCLVLLATDSKLEGAKISQTIRSSYGCDVFSISRTINATTEAADANSFWGVRGQSQLESHSRADRRAILESYLDIFLIEHYSNALLVTETSTFSEFIASIASAHEAVDVVHQYVPHDCSKGFLPYPCCILRQRFNDYAPLFVTNKLRCP